MKLGLLCIILLLFVTIVTKDNFIHANTFSATAIIEHILRHEDDDIPKWSGRVSRVSGGDYNLLRVSKVWKGAPKTKNDFRFKHKWTNFSFSTSIVKIDDDFPQPGAPVRGVMLADVCISSKNIPCSFAKRYKTLERITWALNKLADDGLNFWMMGGDNLYDEDGSISEKFFSKLNPKLLNVPLVSVPGNHDFWTSGAPSFLPNNQMGYGYAQYYMMDTEASKGIRDGFPFNFPTDKGVGIKDIPSADNFFHYSAIGSVGFIAFSGAHEFDANLFEKACRYFSPGHPGQDSTFIFLLGHWSIDNMGCQPDMYTSSVWDIMSNPIGPLKNHCYPLVARNRVYFVDGHFHDNKRLGDFGFRVAGQGMIDTGSFGFPIIEVLNDDMDPKTKRIIVSYVSLAKSWNDPLINVRFISLEKCVDTLGFFTCLTRLPFVDVWVNTTATLP